MHIDDLLLLGNTQVALEILSLNVIHRPSYFIWTILLSFYFLSLLVGFNKKVLQVCGNNMGFGSCKSIQGPIARHQT